MTLGLRWRVDDRGQGNEEDQGVSDRGETEDDVKGQMITVRTGKRFNKRGDTDDELRNVLFIV